MAFSYTSRVCRGSGSLIDKVFVSVYAITETKTTAAKSLISARGSSHCFVTSRTLLCGRGLRQHIELQTKCSLATMAASDMFEFKLHFKHSTAQSSFILINWIILPMAAPRQGIQGDMIGR